MMDIFSVCVLLFDLLFHTYIVVDCGRYSLCNCTFLSSLIKDITTSAYSVVYKLSIKLLVVALLSSCVAIAFEDHLCF